MAITAILIWTLIAALPSSLAFLFTSNVISCRAARRGAIGFFHPYTNDGGGGETVLWCAVRAVQEERPDLDCAVYTGDHDASPDSLTGCAMDRCGVELLRPPKIVMIRFNEGKEWLSGPDGSAKERLLTNL